MKILIVDDDPAILNALDANLTVFGYQVVAAQDGFEAIKILKSSGLGNEPVMFMVTDLKMPGMDGIELIRSARELIPDLNVILMTAYGNKHVRKTVKDLEDCGYLGKPFEREKLHKLIMKVRGRKAN